MILKSGGGLGGTRRGGPEVNIKHSGREDNERERERYRLEREREERGDIRRDRDRGDRDRERERDRGLGRSTIHIFNNFINVLPNNLFTYFTLLELKLMLDIFHSSFFC